MTKMTRGSKADVAVGRTSLRSAGIKKTLRSSSTQQSPKKKTIEVKKSVPKAKLVSIKDEVRKVVGKRNKTTKADKSKQFHEEKSNEEDNKSSTDSTSHGENVRRSSRQATKERKVWSNRKLSSASTDYDSDFDDISNDKRQKKKSSVKERDAKVSHFKRKISSIDNGMNKVVKRLKTDKNEPNDEEKIVKRGRGRPRKIVTEVIESDKEHEMTMEEDSKSVDLNESSTVEDDSQVFTLKSVKETNHPAYDLQVTGDHLGKNNVSLTSQIIRESLLAPPSHLAKSITELKNSDEHPSTTSNALSSKARLIFNKPSTDNFRSSVHQQTRNRFLNKSRFSSKPIRNKGKNWKEILSTNYNKLKSNSEKRKITEEIPSVNGNENYSQRKNKKGSEEKKFKNYISDDDKNEDAASSILRKFRLSQLRTETRAREFKNQNKALQKVGMSSSTSNVSVLNVSTSTNSSDSTRLSTTSDEEKESVRKTVELFEGPVDHIPELPISETINKLKERMSKSDVIYGLSDIIYKPRSVTHSNGEKKYSPQPSEQLLKSDKLNNKVSQSDNSIEKNSSSNTIETTPKISVTNNAPQAHFTLPLPISTTLPLPISTPLPLPISTPLSPEAVEEGKVSLKAALAELLLESELEANMADQNKQTLTIHSAPKSTDVLSPNLLASSIISGTSKVTPSASLPEKKLNSPRIQETKEAEKRNSSVAINSMVDICTPMQSDDLHECKEDELLDYSGVEVDEENDVTIVSSAALVSHCSSAVDNHKMAAPQSTAKAMPHLIKIPFRPLTIKTPLKCPICPMQFCTVRSLLWHFGQHGSSILPPASKPQQRNIPCPLLEDLKAPWTFMKNDENSKPHQLFKNLTQIAIPNVFSGPLPESSKSEIVKGTEKVTNSQTKKKPIPNLCAPKANPVNRVKGIGKKGDLAALSQNKSIKKNSIIPEKNSSAKGSRITGSNLKNNPFASKMDRDFSAPQHIISHNTPLAATSTGVVATVLGNHTISEVTDKVKNITSKKSSNRKKSDVILKIPIPRLNKAPTSPTPLPNSPQNKTKFVNILPKMSAYSSPPYCNNQPINLSTKDNSFSTAKSLNLSARTDRSPPPFSNSKLRHSLSITPVTSINSRLCSSSENSHGHAMSNINSLNDDSLVMINSNLGLRIVSTIGSSNSFMKSSPSSAHQMGVHSDTTTTSAVNVKPIMSPIAPSNILTIVPNSGKDSLTIVPQNSKEASKHRRIDGEIKTPDILTIVPQVDSKSGSLSSRNNNNPPTQIMTAVGQMSPSQAMNLVLLRQNDKNIVSPRALSPRRLSAVLRSPNARLNVPNVSSPSRTSFRNRSFTSDADELDSEDDKMLFIDDRSIIDDESGNDSTMDPLAMCSVTLDEESKEGKAIAQKTLSNFKATSPKMKSKSIPMSPPPRLHALSSIPNLTPLSSASFSRSFKPIAPMNKPPITLVPINSPALIPHGIASLATQAAVSFNSHPVRSASSTKTPSGTLALSPQSSSPPESSSTSMCSLGHTMFNRKPNISSPGSSKTSRSLVAPNVPSSVMVPNIGNVIISTGSIGSSSLNKVRSAASCSNSVKEDNEPIYKHTVEMDTSKYNKRKYVCKFCGRRFGWSTDLKRHVILHTGERPFKCDTCGNTFTRKFLLQNHMKRAHEEEEEEEEQETELLDSNHSSTTEMEDQT